MAIRAIRGPKIFRFFTTNFTKSTNREEGRALPWHVCEGGFSNGQIVHRVFFASWFLCVTPGFSFRMCVFCWLRKWACSAIKPYQLGLGARVCGDGCVVKIARLRTTVGLGFSPLESAQSVVCDFFGLRRESVMNSHASERGVSCSYPV